MNQLEFQTAITPILSKWPRSYSGDQVQLIQEEVRFISHDDFCRLVRHLLGSMRVAPMVPDFKKGITDLGIRLLKVAHNQPTQSQAQTIENYYYCIRENIWADNTHIFIRGSRPSFIIKKDSPDHPYVAEDYQVRSARIKEIKDHLSKNSFQKFMDSLNPRGDGMQRAFSMEGK